jgi:hypothetical protein
MVFSSSRNVPLVPNDDKMMINSTSRSVLGLSKGAAQHTICINWSKIQIRGAAHQHVSMKGKQRLQSIVQPKITCNNLSDDCK